MQQESIWTEPTMPLPEVRRAPESVPEWKPKPNNAPPRTVRDGGGRERNRADNRHLTPARVDEMLRLIGLEPSEFARRKPASLSGGQRRRLATRMQPHPAQVLAEGGGEPGQIRRRQRRARAGRPVEPGTDAGGTGQPLRPRLGLALHAVGAVRAGVVGRAA